MASNENLPPSVMTRILREMRDLLEKPPEGVKVLMNEDDMTDIQAYIEGPEGTPYVGGSFRMKLTLTSEFPSAPPKGYFLTKIFHPNVSKTGEICVSALKKDWKPTLGLRTVFMTIRCLLIAPNPESALNEEAGRLLLEAYDDYAKHARLMTEIHASRKEGAPAPAVEESSEGPAAAPDTDTTLLDTTNMPPTAGDDAAAKKKKAPPKKDEKKKGLRRL